MPKNAGKIAHFSITYEKVNKADCVRLGRSVLNQLARNTCVAFVVEKQWQMEYYVNLVETGYMDDMQRLKGCQIYLQ